VPWTSARGSVAAPQGDELARRLYRRMGVVLGIGISNLINTLNLHRIIIGGQLSKAGDLFLQSCTQSVVTRAWHASTKDIVVSGLERGEVIEAAALVLKQIFSTAQIVGHRHAPRAIRLGRARRS
jgi:glucokinase